MFNVPVQDSNPLASSHSNAYCYGIIKELYATKVQSIPTLNSLNCPDHHQTSWYLLCLRDLKIGTSSLRQWEDRINREHILRAKNNMKIRGKCELAPTMKSSLFTRVRGHVQPY